MKNKKSEIRAREIIDIHLNNIERYLPNELVSVVLVGSLSNDSYTGNAGSDIDLIHILKEGTFDEVRNRVRDAISITESITNNDLPIAKCIYKLNEMKRPFKSDFELCLENKDLIELPIEILRIKDSGITIWGTDVIDYIDDPIRDDIIKSKKLTIMWNKLEQDRFPDKYEEYYKYVINPTTRILVQSIIVNAMLDYYFITGKSCSSKKEIGNRIRHEVKDYIFQELLDLCIIFRYTPELVTSNQEQWMHDKYNEWRKMRSNKEIGNVAHLL